VPYAPSHATTEHDVRVLGLDESRHLTRLVPGVEGVVDHLHGFKFRAFHFDDREKGAAPKVMGDLAFQLVVGICGYSNAHG
jgi:hypothetical protein